MSSVAAEVSVLNVRWSRQHDRTLEATTTLFWEHNKMAKILFGLSTSSW
jgi:hypothetical protein